MTLIEDMTAPQRQAWVTILGDVAVFGWFLSRTLHEGRIIDHSPASLGGILIGVIIVSIIVHGVIAAIFEMKRGKSDEGNVKDERDKSIANQSDKWGYYILTTVIAVVLFNYLMHLQFGEEYTAWLRPADPAHLVFALVSGSFLADLVRMGSRLWAYHR